MDFKGDFDTAEESKTSSLPFTRRLTTEMTPTVDVGCNGAATPSTEAHSSLGASTPSPSLGHGVNMR
ncbi:uncharacterized protein G2W53_004680 [Senna tora]|uniref:Uncharacterized protein n=1 Tax=Senna tora TaxID=362788 RepID=A0A834XCN1_9FABA|nr:uncharacterized protein G2W53_004680 [Senna tora]